MSKDSLEKLQQQLIEFSNARHWEKFHSPKNLSMALSVEVAELVEHFQWLTEDESRQIKGNKKDARDNFETYFLVLETLEEKQVHIVLDCHLIGP